MAHRILTEIIRKAILRPYNHLENTSGNDIRPKIIEAFNYWFDVQKDKVDLISDITQRTENASLLLDDIEDNSITRRGKPSAHIVYGISNTINAANYALFMTFSKLPLLGHSQAIPVYTNILTELSVGQGLDIYWQENHICPTEEEYMVMANKKTGALFELKLKLLELCSKKTPEIAKLERLMYLLGIHFQITNDYSNLVSKNNNEISDYCTDIQNGKFTFPIIHGIRSKKDDLIMDILRQRPKNIETLQQCLSLLKKAGSLKYTEDTMNQLEIESKLLIDGLGGNPILTNLLNGPLKWQNVCS